MYIKDKQIKADTGFAQINYRQGLNFLLNVTQEGIKSPSSYVIFPVLSQTDLINGSSHLLLLLAWLSFILSITSSTEKNDATANFISTLCFDFALKFSLKSINN